MWFVHHQLMGLYLFLCQQSHSLERACTLSSAGYSFIKVETVALLGSSVLCSSNAVPFAAGASLLECLYKLLCFKIGY